MLILFVEMTNAQTTQALACFHCDAAISTRGRTAVMLEAIASGVALKQRQDRGAWADPWVCSMHRTKRT